MNKGEMMAYHWLRAKCTQWLELLYMSELVSFRKQREAEIRDQILHSHSRRVHAAEQNVDWCDLCDDWGSGWVRAALTLQSYTDRCQNNSFFL